LVQARQFGPLPLDVMQAIAERVKMMQEKT